MRFLFSPRWLLLIVAVVGFVVACYTLLAPWQFGREAEREAQQAAIDASRATPPVPLAEVVPAGEGVGPGDEWRRVTVSGTYLPEAETLVRLRVVEGKPAYEVLTPLRTAGGGLVLVDRGFVTADGTAVPPIAAPPDGPVELTGWLRPDQADPQGRAAVTDAGRVQVYAADSRAVAAATGLDLPAGYLQLEAGQPGVLGPLPVTPSTGGAPFSNLSYALQWLTFGAIALVALGLFVRLELLQRRRAGAAAGAAEDGDETPLEHRYGRR